MENSVHIPFADRLGVAVRAIRGLIKSPTPQDILGVYASLFPGGPGSPPPKGVPELVKSYSDMPWINAAVGRIASGTASVEWKVYVVRGTDGDVKRRRDLQRADYATRRRIFSRRRKEVQYEEVVDHPLPQVLQSSNPFVLGLTTQRLTQIYLELVGEAYWIKERNEFGMPIALWPLPPNWVITTPTPIRPAFEVKFMGWQGWIPASEIVWFVNPDPVNPYGRGVGAGSPEFLIIDEADYLLGNERSLNFFRDLHDETGIGLLFSGQLYFLSRVWDWANTGGRPTMETGRVAMGGAMAAFADRLRVQVAPGLDDEEVVGIVEDTCKVTLSEEAAGRLVLYVNHDFRVLALLISVLRDFRLGAGSTLDRKAIEAAWVRSMHVKSRPLG